MEVRLKKLFCAKSLFLLIAFAYLAGAVHAVESGKCPAGASDCFLCGGVNGIPCSSNCIGHYKPGVGNIACECPQGKPCVCYCPAVGISEKEPEATQDKCAGVSCLSSCAGSTHKYDGKCDPVTGKCGYSSEYCEHGCDPSTGACASAEKDLCADVDCPDKCESPNNDFAAAVSRGGCDRNTGECVYGERKKCTVGCSMKDEKALCNEDCDNGIDDDGDGLADCGDSDCKESLYCSCRQIGKTAGSIGGRPLVILLGGYSFPGTTLFYNYKSRDSDVEQDAIRITNALKSTAPFNEMSFELYATRLSEGIFSGPWKSDLLSKCAGNGGDFTLFINYKDSKSLSNSRAFSMSATVYRGQGTPSAEDLENTVLHEMGHGFAGLWDEYTIAEGIGLPAGMLAVIRDAGFSSRSNCAIASDIATCQQYFSKFGVSYDCVKGCSAGAWYRPSQESLMNDVYSSSQFNEVSKKIIRDRINAFAHPPPRTKSSWQPYRPPEPQQ